RDWSSDVCSSDLGAPGERQDLVEETRVDADAAQDGRQARGRKTARHHVGVERVDERVELPVVAEEELRRPGRRREPAAQQLGQLEAHVLAQVAELAAL